MTNTSTESSGWSYPTSKPGQHNDRWKATNPRDPFGLFIRSIVGLDRAAAKQSFAAFLDDKRYSRNQIEFVNLVVDYLAEHGAIDPGRVYESPFTDVAPQGSNTIFSTDLAGEDGHGCSGCRPPGIQYDLLHRSGRRGWPRLFWLSPPRDPIRSSPPPTSTSSSTSSNTSTTQLWSEQRCLLLLREQHHGGQTWQSL